MSKKIIVIGGGISGLIAGIYALKEGFDVEIFESHKETGGMCAQWKRNGIDCTSAVHWMMGAKTGSDLNEIWKTTGAIENNTVLFTLDYMSACIDKDSYCYLYADIEKLEIELLRISPQDIDAIKELISEIKIYQKLPIPACKPMELMTPMEKAISFAPYIKAEKKTSLNNISVAQYAERFQSPIIRSLLLSVVPDSKLSANMLMIWLASNCNGDTAFPLNGFFAMAKRMEQKFFSAGGKIHTNTPVKKIVVKDGIATGVVLADGSEVYANYIVSSVSPDVLLEKLLENKISDTYFEKRLASQSRFFTPALTQINLNIRAKMNLYPHTLVVEPKYPLFIHNTKVKYLKINHFAFSPYCCNEEKIQVQVVLQEQEFEYWKNLKTKSENEYNQAKLNLAMQVIREIETVYPETKGKTELLDVATPLTLQHYCHSYRGSYLSFCATSDFMQRENHEGIICGVKNIYLAGQWVFPDGGVPMAAIAGKFSVQRICNQENIDFNINN